MESKSTHLLTGDVKRSSGRVKSSGGRRLNTVGQPPGPGQDRVGSHP